MHGTHSKFFADHKLSLDDFICKRRQEDVDCLSKSCRCGSNHGTSLLALVDRTCSQSCMYNPSSSSEASLTLQAYNTSTAKHILTHKAESLITLFRSLDETMDIAIGTRNEVNELDELSFTSDIFSDDEFGYPADEGDEFWGDESSLSESAMDFDNVAEAETATDDYPAFRIRNEPCHHALRQELSFPELYKVKSVQDSQHPQNLKIVESRLRYWMDESLHSQAALQNWDRLNGLPASHSKTMVNTSRSREQLLKGVILRKWDGSPLIACGASS